MKIDRLLSIVIILINRRRVQAQDLAEQFEVSVRTIYRDIDSINMAGIPVVTYQGSGGGIGLAEGYRLEKHLLTEDDIAAITTALNSISTPYSHSDTDKLMKKLETLIPPEDNDEYLSKSNQLLIDLSSWEPHDLVRLKLTTLKESISAQQTVSFSYTNAQGQVTNRTCDPYALILKGRAWYLYSFCHDRQEFRMFKLKRMKELVTLNENFARQPVQLTQLPWNQEWHTPQKTTNLVLRFEKDAKFMAEEFFGVEALRLEDDGRFTVSTSMPEDSGLYSYLLSFGDWLEVLEPEHIRNEMKRIAEGILHKYILNVSQT